MGLLSNEVSDLCIGKPALRPLPPNATVGDAVFALKLCGEPCLSIWVPDRSSPDRKACAGKVCMVDVLCYLCAGDNVKNPSWALKSPVTALLAAKDAGLVRRVEPHASVLEALDLILDGAQNLVVPIRGGGAGVGGRKKLHNPEFCWLTQEDFVRYFFNSIGIFSPIAALSVTALGLVRTDVLTVRHHEPALAALPLIGLALAEQTSVAVVTDDGKLIGEISPSTLTGCDETVAAAIPVLSAGDFMSYIDCYGSPPEGAVLAIKARLKEKGMEGMLKLIEEEQLSPNTSLLSSSSLSSSSSPSSSDEEFASGKGRSHRKPRRQKSGSYSARMGRRSEEAIVCHPGSSLVAVMVQAMAHRVGYAWVVEEEYDLVGIVTLQDILRLFKERL